MLAGCSPGEVFVRPGAASLKLGRIKTGNTFTFKAATVSSRHAELVWDDTEAAGGGTWYLVDLDSSNGTQLNGNRKCLAGARVCVCVFCPPPPSSCRPRPARARAAGRARPVALEERADIPPCTGGAGIRLPAAGAGWRHPPCPHRVRRPAHHPSRRPALPAARPGRHPPWAGDAAAGQHCSARARRGRADGGAEAGIGCGADSGEHHGASGEGGSKVGPGRCLGGACPPAPTARLVQGLRHTWGADWRAPRHPPTRGVAPHPPPPNACCPQAAAAAAAASIREDWQQQRQDLERLLEAC